MTKAKAKKMKVLITGATSRQTNPKKNAGDVMFSWLMGAALESAGHEVELRRPNIEEDLDEYDHVFVGLTPLHGLGASSAYGSLSAILRGWGDPSRLSLYIDDPDVIKVSGGIRTMRTNPERLMKPFFAYRREYDIAVSKEWSPWLREGVDKLDTEEWPRLIVPMHGWADAEAAYAKRVPQAAGRIVGLDLSTFLPTYPCERGNVREQYWIYEDRVESKWRRQVQTRFDVRRWGKDSPHGRRPHDVKLVEAYSEAWGVMAPPSDPAGWWTSRMGYAAQAGAVYCTKWQDLQALGDDYTWLPYQVEELTPKERDELADRQREIFYANSTKRDTVVSTLEDIVGAKVGA